MKFENPPHGGKYKLVVTKRYPNDIGLVVLCETQSGIKRRDYSWTNIPFLYNKDLKDYLLSLRKGIVSGVYDLDLLEKELKQDN